MRLVRMGNKRGSFRSYFSEWPGSGCDNRAARLDSATFFPDSSFGLPYIGVPLAFGPRLGATLFSSLAKQSTRQRQDIATIRGGCVIYCAHRHFQTSTSRFDPSPVTPLPGSSCRLSIATSSYFHLYQYFFALRLNFAFRRLYSHST